MPIRMSTLFAPSALFVMPAVARGQAYPSSTDEARALAGRMLPAEEPRRPVPPGAIASSTDEARELAGRMLPTGERGPVRSIAAISSTDEARAVAGGLAMVAAPAVAPAERQETVASCGRTCKCGRGG